MSHHYLVSHYKPLNVPNHPLSTVEDLAIGCRDDDDGMTPDFDPNGNELPIPIV